MRTFISALAAASGFVVLHCATQRALWILFLSAFVLASGCGYEIGIMPPIRCNRVNGWGIAYESACEQKFEFENDPNWSLQHPETEMYW